MVDNNLSPSLAHSLQPLFLKTRPHERLALDRSSIVFFFLTGAWLKYSVADTAWRLIRLVPSMAAQADLAEGLFDLPINASSRLR
jgi:hypothetical protein